LWVLGLSLEGICPYAQLRWAVSLWHEIWVVLNGTPSCSREECSAP
jgi:hypothetical protein